MNNCTIHSIDPLDMLSFYTSYFVLLVPHSNPLVSLLVHSKNASIKRVCLTEYSWELMLDMETGIQGVLCSQGSEVAFDTRMQS